MKSKNEFSIKHEISCRTNHETYEMLVFTSYYLVYLIFSIIATFFGVIVSILEAKTGERIASAGVWGSTLGFISSVN